MVGTEYFVRGTEPAEVCHLHVGRSLFGQIAGWFGGGGERAGRRTARRGRRPHRGTGRAAPVSPAQEAPAVAEAPAPEAKKRGFWSRLFGRARQAGREESEEGRAGATASPVAPSRCRFATSIGHARLIALLASAARRGSLPPALLFAGPAGVGKWRMAQALAQAVNCPSPLDGDACGTCRSCDRIARGVHVDVVVADARRHRRHQDRSGARGPEGLRLPALRGAAAGGRGPRRRCAQRAGAECVPQVARGAAAGTMFVFTSAAPDALLRTVRSRLMRLAFGRLTTDDVVRLLVRDHGRPTGSGAPGGAARRRQRRRGARARVGGPGRVARSRAVRLLGAAATPISAPASASPSDVDRQAGTDPPRTGRGAAHGLVADPRSGGRARRGRPRARSPTATPPTRSSGWPASCRRPRRAAPSPPSTAAWPRSNATPGRSWWPSGWPRRSDEILIA